MTEEPLNKIKRMINYLCESAGQEIPNEDPIDFMKAQEIAQSINKGDFNGQRNSDGTYNQNEISRVLEDLKLFLAKIVNKRIVLSIGKLINAKFNLSLQQNTPNGNIEAKKNKEEIETKRTIADTMIGTLRNSVQNNLIGDTFEGLVMKKKDMNPGPDLDCGIELKTTSINSNRITLFSAGLSEEQENLLSESINEFIDSIEANGSAIKMSFEKTMFSGFVDNGDDILGNGFNRNNYSEKVIGQISGYEGMIGKFILGAECNDYALVYKLFGSINDKKILLASITLSYNKPNTGIRHKINDKLSTVFHVRGTTGTIADENEYKGETYVMFTGYEILKLKAGYNIKDLILRGVLRPYFRASFTSINDDQPMQTYSNGIEKIDWKSWRGETEPELDFDSAENQNEPEPEQQIAQPTEQPQVKQTKQIQPVQLELDFNGQEELNEDRIRINRSFNNRVLDTSNNNMLDVKGIVFKIDMKSLTEMFEIERK